jgi:hypothetical protein
MGGTSFIKAPDNCRGYEDPDLQPISPVPKNELWEGILCFMSFSIYRMSSGTDGQRPAQQAVGPNQFSGG